MAPWVNRILKGQKASYKLLEMLKEPSLSKAEILPPITDYSMSSASSKLHDGPAPGDSTCFDNTIA